MNNQYLKNNLFKMLMIFTVSLIFWISIASSLYKIPNTKKISIFISSNYIDNDFFENTIKQVPDVLKVDLMPRSPMNEYFESFLQTNGLYSDILIISDKYFENEHFDLNFSIIDLKYFEDYKLDLNKYELVIDDNQCFGIVIYDKEKRINLFKNRIVFENNERYILCVGKKTPNIYQNPKNQKQTDHAFKAVMELLVSISK